MPDSAVQRSPSPHTIRTEYEHGRLATEITYYPTPEAIPEDHYQLWVEFVRLVMEEAPEPVDERQTDE